MAITGYVLAIIGCIGALVGEVRVLALAYRRGFGWLLGLMLFGPLCWLALLALDFKSTVKPSCLAVLGLVLAGLGGRMAGLE
jgi:hypothetical protein